MAMSNLAIKPLLDLKPNALPEAVPGEFFIYGMTNEGKVFRPSDWAERLCGVLACYRPGGMAAGRDAFIGYSPYVRPITHGGVRCVVVDERLKEIEPMALTFVLSFARDNDLPVIAMCSLPEPPKG